MQAKELKEELDQLVAGHTEERAKGAAVQFVIQASAWTKWWSMETGEASFQLMQHNTKTANCMATVPVQPQFFNYTVCRL